MPYINKIKYNEECIQDLIEEVVILLIIIKLINKNIISKNKK